MKKKLVLAGFIGFTFLFGCSQIGNEDKVKAYLPNTFNQVSKDEFNDMEIYKVKEEVNGCYYVIAIPSYGTSYTPSVTQMMVEKDGVTVPYCEGGKK